MSENPEDPPGDDRTRRIGDPPPGHTRPGQSIPPSGQDYGQSGQGHGAPGQGYGQPGQGQGHGQPGQGYGYPGQGYGQPDQGYGKPGQGYEGYPPTSPYDPGGYQGGHQPGYPGYPEYGAYGAPQGYGYQAPPGTYGPRPGSDDTTMAMLAHLLGLLTSFVGPLVLYLAKKDESPYVRDQAAEALNFQLTVLVAYVVSWVLAFVLIGFVLMFFLWIGAIIVTIIAAVAANRGERYRYPMNIRFVS
ncbi:hypothetical protein GCM10022252_52720 [Streptosporangium oxazolinicum]|uniref:DUF4870 domain-containing protein n=1 Tax=Streptosporangium oxazolinicum TaxID=909287 RepID=A0ABP8B7S4_9ACTN